MISLHKSRFSLKFQKDSLSKLNNWFSSFFTEKCLFLFSSICAILATIYSYTHNYILAYGDAESHINIAKRVVSALTPGFAQLGGIWEPLPHIMMIPFVYSDFLWRTGLAGSLVFGVCFIVSSVYLFKLVYLLTNNKWASFIGYLIFVLNPNLLYLQSTPMTEIPLIMFTVLSCYFFAKYLFLKNKVPFLVLAAACAFFASICRYDGWLLVIFESIAVVIFEYLERRSIARVIDRIILFGTLAFLGIILWFAWNWIILGDPLYFEHSVYAAKSQQESWLLRHELPAYKNIGVSLLYYFVDSYMNIGFFIYIAGLIGFIIFLFKERNYRYYLLAFILLTPFVFNTVTLYAGESVIFLPTITPRTFQWTLFNVRYGIIMAPVVAFFFGYLFSKGNLQAKVLLLGVLVSQTLLFATGAAQIITLKDGTTGLSTATVPWDAENFINKHYDGGLLLEDDFARSLSITRSTVPMENIIYVGTKPYYAISLQYPEKYARWIIMQKNDEIWKALYANTVGRKNLYKYFQKEYTSDRILIFRRI
jgi:hypothetical protein